MSLAPRRRLYHLLLMLLLMSASPWVCAQTMEQKLKAAFLYRFSQFVDWPPEVMAKRGGQLVLCMLGKDSFDSALDDIEGKSVGEHTIVIRYISTAEQVDQCQVVFINQPKSRWEEVFQYSQHAHVLTVSDSEGFAHSGGVIEMVRADNRIQFLINLSAAKASELRVSAQLLKLARDVYE